MFRATSPKQLIWPRRDSPVGRPQHVGAIPTLRVKAHGRGDQLSGGGLMN